MKIVTIEKSLSREAFKYEDSIVRTSCIQQSEITDNDMQAFLLPMAEYIAQLLIYKD